VTFAEVRSLADEKLVTCEGNALTLSEEATKALNALAILGDDTAAQITVKDQQLVGVAMNSFQMVKVVMPCAGLSADIDFGIDPRMFKSICGKQRATITVGKGETTIANGKGTFTIPQPVVNVVELPKFEYEAVAEARVENLVKAIKGAEILKKADDKLENILLQSDGKLLTAEVYNEPTRTYSFRTDITRQVSQPVKVAFKLGLLTAACRAFDGRVKMSLDNVKPALFENVEGPIKTTVITAPVVVSGEAEPSKREKAKASRKSKSEEPKEEEEEE